jgi:hypothetical protein
MEWRDGSIYDRAVPGFLDWAEQAKKHFKLVIYSSRSKDSAGLRAMMEWMIGQLFVWGQKRDRPDDLWLGDFEFASEKPPAWLTIDDRAICFQGDWSAPELQPEAMKAFKPWMQRPRGGSG